MYLAMAQDPQRQSDVRDKILLALPQATWQRMRSRLEFIDIRRGKVLYRVGNRIEQLYFINRGLVSLIKTMQDGRRVEIGAVGSRELPVSVRSTVSRVLSWNGSGKSLEMRFELIGVGSEAK